MYSQTTTNKMQHYTIIFILLSMLYMFQAVFSAHHQELKELYTQHRALSSFSAKSPTLVIGTRKA
jgi:hypothetical protein